MMADRSAIGDDGVAGGLFYALPLRNLTIERARKDIGEVETRAIAVGMADVAHDDTACRRMRYGRPNARFEGSTHRRIERWQLRPACCRLECIDANSTIHHGIAQIRPMEAALQPALPWSSAKLNSAQLFRDCIELPLCCGYLSCGSFETGNQCTSPRID